MQKVIDFKFKYFYTSFILIPAHGGWFFLTHRREDMPWYTLQTNPNYEAKVIAGIEKRREEHNLHQIREIFAPEELVVDYKDGKKRERKKRLFSNYIFLEMDYSDEVWHSLKGIRGVVGFVGNKTKPEQLSAKEVEKMKLRVSSDAPKPKVMFEPNTKVRIIDGSFADFNGVVKSVDYEKNKAKVTITVFNRETDVDLELTSIEESRE